MRSRFEWGLITDIQPPDLETRIAILRKKTLQEKLTAPPEVLEFIASKISTNIRELEGALIRVTAFASLNRQPVDLPLAEVVLKDLIPDQTGPEITAATIMAQTAAYFGVTIDDLTGASRSRVLVTARQIAMYLCRELTDLSLPKIGQQFGNRDHTTVMHADRKIRTAHGRAPQPLQPGRRPHREDPDHGPAVLRSAGAAVRAPVGSGYRSRCPATLPVAPLPAASPVGSGDLGRHRPIHTLGISLWRTARWLSTAASRGSSGCGRPRPRRPPAARA